MTKHVHIVLWLPLLYAALFLAFWIRLFLNEQVSFEAFLLEKQANYAADSAIDALLEDSDLDTDYSSDFVTVEPDLAVRDFTHTLCLNNNNIPTDYTMRKLMNNNIRMFAVCAYDGYYLYYVQKSATGTYELKSTPKIPYFYNYYNDPAVEAAMEPNSDQLRGDMSETDIFNFLNNHTQADRQYCLTLNPEIGYWDYTIGTKFYTHQRGKYLDGRDEYKNSQSSISSRWESDGSDSGFYIPSVDQQLTAINYDVSKGVDWALYQTYATYSTSNRIELPSTGDMIRGQQPVKAPTVIAFIEGKTKSYLSNVTAECIGGSQFEDSDLVVGFTFNDVKIVRPYYDSEKDTYYYGDEALGKWRNWWSKNHPGEDFEASGWAYFKEDNSKPYSSIDNKYTTLSGRYYAYASWWNTHRYIKDQLTNLTGRYFDDVYDAAKNNYIDVMPGN